MIYFSSVPKAIKLDKSLIKGKEWFHSNGWKLFPFQSEAWNAYSDGKSGMINAPTGSGKTYSLLIPILLTHGYDSKKGLKAIWVSPIRALTKEIKKSADRAIAGLGLSWRVEIRSGDTTTTNRAKQLKNPPDILITTPESIHVILSSKGYKKFFGNLKAVVIDEWHELVGSKRGVQVELALSKFKALNVDLRIWGISATIGNMNQSMQVLLGFDMAAHGVMIKSEIKKKIEVITIKPDEIEKFPWAGHLGIKLIHKLIPIIKESRSTLIFINTRALCEIWYQKILEMAPELAGIIAMHHGSIAKNLRDWVENALHDETIKAVCCTSSLDLGVDFRPVETIVQIGSPKGVARFLQRAGRSGHQPGATSKIYFLPTHSLELVEAAALRKAIFKGNVEERIPYIRSFDVLVQYLMSLAVSDGFREKEIFEEVKHTFCYNSMTRQEWNWILSFLVHGGPSLNSYDEYKKVEIDESIYKVNSRRIALRHKMSIGTITSSASLNVKFLSGKRVGTVEEWFAGQLSPGDVFWFSGRNLEFVRIKEMTVIVKKTTKKTGRVPSFMGGRMPLSSNLAEVLRDEYTSYYNDEKDQQEELRVLKPLFDKQQALSHIPRKDELLIEYFEDKEGSHLVFYPFEGRYVHEGLGVLLAKRIGDIVPISFTIAMNDYGVELLSDQSLDLKLINKELFHSRDLELHIQGSINAAEMARRQFRDIARISGLIFTGYPGKSKKERHLQSSSQLLFDVFEQYEPENLLYQQTFDEVMTFQLEEARMRKALERIQNSKIILLEPRSATPFAFPLIVDRLRAKMSSEKLEDRIRKMTLILEAD